MDPFKKLLKGTEFEKGAKPEEVKHEGEQHEQHSTLCITDMKIENDEHFITYGELVVGCRIQWYQVSIDEYVKIENALIELDYYLNHRN